MSNNGTRRVLRLLTRMNIGGPARHALVLSRGLAPEYETVLAAGRPALHEGELTDPDVPVHRVPLVREMNPRADMRSMLAVRSLMLEHRPQLLHTHMAKAGSVGRLAAFTLRSRPITVHTFHGHVLEGYFGPAARQAFLQTERALARRTDALVAVSTEIRDELLALRIGRPSQFHVMPLGLDLTRFLAIERPSGQLRARLCLAPEVPLVGVVGRLVPIKDHETLLRAMGRVADAHLAVIGDGMLRQALQARAHELGIESRVHFTGWCADMPEAVSDLDVVALSSRNEGTPLALIEASAAGRAVLSTDVGGVRSVVRDGVTGVLVAAGDDEAIASRLTDLLREPATRERMGQAGREHVRDRFGAVRLVADMRALYGDMLAAPRRVSRS